MPGAIEFILNGRPVRLVDCSPNTLLLDYLRGAGLTGAKEGCAEGDCGACSVAMLERDADGRAVYRAFNSCLTPVCLVAGRELVTAEGLEQGGCLHPVQAQMVARHGSQCGYCTPGVVMSLFEGYYRQELTSPDQLDDQLCGNLCRCTGYRPIRDAAIAARPQPTDSGPPTRQDPFGARLSSAPPILEPVDFEFQNAKFLRPRSLPELLRCLHDCPEARLIAGATELGLDISKRFKTFPTLISVEGVPELSRVELIAEEWHIGAAASLTRIEEKVAPEFPALGAMLRVFGSRQIRNRATMGGNIVTASPIGDSAPVLLALDAKVVLVSLARPANGSPDSLAERTLPISEFFVAYRKTALEPGEVLKSIILPRDFGVNRGTPDGAQRFCRFYKVSKRREMDISTVAACFAIQLDGRGTVQQARLGYGGVAAMPARARQTEEALLGKAWDADTLQKVLATLRSEFTPISDARGSAEYRRGLITSLLGKFHFDTTNGEPDEPPGSFPVPPAPSVLAPPHESARQHVTGHAVYADDQAARKTVLEVWPVCSPHAHARILQRDATAARAQPGIRAVILAEDIPGDNNVGGLKKDEILLADKEVSYHGQLVALVVGESQAACRAAAEKVVVEYEPLPEVFTLKQALGRRSFHNAPNYICRGKVRAALAKAPLTLKGTFELGGQEHFYLETNAAWAEPGEDGAVFVSSSTQHPSEVQAVVGHVLHRPANKVVVQVPRLGGGFGGKETQAATPAALAALAATHTGHAVRVRWNRDQDMMLTGHRHPFLARFRVGFDTQGRLMAARIHLYSNGGWAMDLSQAVTDRALFHLDNAYYIPAVKFRGQVLKTNLSSNTAFRGFGGPQGMLVMEEILDRIARRLGLPPELVRERNLYRGKGATNTTHYGQNVGDQRLRAIWGGLMKSSDFIRRRRAIARWNTAHPHRKRGLAITPVKFGISFTVTHLNQAGALVLLYPDGSIQVNHGGTEMGQGVHSNIALIAARELGLETAQVRVMPTSTDKVPNTSATAASCGTDLNGAAVKDACESLRARLAPVAVELLREKLGPLRPAEVVFAKGAVFARRHPRVTLRFAEVARRAYLQRVNLSATGYYATPGIHWDRVAGRGRPFLYFACGAAVAEVELDGFTGMMRLRRVDILHDAGESINPGINRGQIEGGFIQGLGWLTTEELLWDERGRLLTHSPDTYKIPAVGDTPAVFNVTLLPRAAQQGVVYGSKAVGEPPFMLAIAVREAIRDAIAAFGPPGGVVPLASPATCEAVYLAIEQRRSRPAQRSRKLAAA